MAHSPHLPVLDIPEIAVIGESTDDLSPRHGTQDASGHSSLRPTIDIQTAASPSARARSPSDGTLLSPILRPQRSTISDTPSSPGGSTSHYSDDHPPPSPTLSAHSASNSSVHFAPSTLALRDNSPEQRDGQSSLGLLDVPRGHRRKGSNATFTSTASGSETLPDHSHSDGEEIGLSPIPSPSSRSDAASTLASPTNTHVGDFSDAGDSRPTSQTSFFKKRHRNHRPSKSPDPGSDSGRDGGEDGHGRDDDDADKDKAEKPHLVDLEQEANVDPTPFSFKPAQLAQLLDPKSIEGLEAMGGVDGLMKGLGTHATLGLGAGKGKAAATHEAQGDDDGSGEVGVPDITITNPVGEEEGVKSSGNGGVSDSKSPSPSGTPPNSTSTDGGDGEGAVRSNPKAFEAGIEERRRVYGPNILPERPSKSLWMLMWLAMKDKVLVSNFRVSC